MTALDRAFIRAYGRPRSGQTAKPASRSATPAAAAQTTVAFERGASLHRIDLPAGTGEAKRSGSTESRVSTKDAAATALPSVEEIFSHAVGIADVIDSPSPESLSPQSAASLGSVKRSVAATAADLREAWPARFSSDARTLFDQHSEANAASDFRPLSAFAPIVHAAEPVRPLLEVDRFDWSPQCQALCASSPAALDQFVSRLLSGAAEGAHRVALIGLDAASGRTTAAMCLARRAASRGENWVLVDADFDKPELAARLGIVPQMGWSHVVSGEQDLANVMIASIEDRFAIVPLEAGSVGREALRGNARAAEVFDMLADAYGVVLIDAGSPGPRGVERLAAFNRTAHLDATYLVYDARKTTAGDVAAYARQLAAVGLRVAGAIENFAPRSGAAADS